MTRRLYADVPWGQAHARVAGDGPPVLLLHASPLNGAFLAPQMQALVAAGFRAIALDTPGYGASDPLPDAARDIAAFGDAVIATADALGLARFGLYGTATGAQIALAAAKRAPGRVARLVLENCGHFDPAVRAAWEEAYFPDLSPQPDGTHLARIWDMAARQLTRFPWHIDPPPGASPPPPPPLSVLCAMARAFLEAGPAYDRAYRLAFHAEEAASFAGLAVSTVLLDWEGSVVRAELQALVAEGLPPCVEVRRSAAGMPGRLAGVVAAFEGLAA